MNGYWLTFLRRLHVEMRDVIQYHSFENLHEILRWRLENHAYILYYIVINKSRVTIIN